MKKDRKTLLLCLAVPLAVGGVSAWLTQDGMEAFRHLRQPPLSPPQWLFPIVWTILFLLMGWASFRVCSAGAPAGQTGRALGVYVLQLIVNFLWPVFFFKLDWYLFALLWLLLLWVLIWILLILFARICPSTWWMLAPYLGWVSFAAYLNWGIWQLN